MIVFALSPIISGRQAPEALAVWGSATGPETEVGTATARVGGRITSIDTIEARGVSLSYLDGLDGLANTTTERLTGVLLPSIGQRV